MSFNFLSRAFEDNVFPRIILSSWLGPMLLEITVIVDATTTICVLPCYVTDQHVEFICFFVFFVVFFICFAGLVINGGMWKISIALDGTTVIGLDVERNNYGT